MQIDLFRIASAKKKHMSEDKYWNYTGKYKSFNDPIFLKILCESDSKWKFYLKEEFFYNYDEKQPEEEQKPKETKEQNIKFRIFIVGVITLFSLFIYIKETQIYHILNECRKDSIGVKK
ncbi:MAG: hypothetical protein KME64_35015 [Scytonematopsis contorta HA4267-MV1]|jgi:hypothetical protein|nr:hypothetical protein [Scytonematopsis contorta HA4267-MV1]